MENYVFSPFMGGLFNVLLDRLVSPEMKDSLIGRDSTALLIDKLKLQMLAIRAVLYDAEKKRHDNPFVNKWLQMLKDAIFDAEDLIDEIHTKALQQRVMQSEPLHENTKKKVESEAQSSNITETQSSNVTETQSSNMIEALHSGFMSFWSKTASLATSLNPFHEGIDLKINNLCQRLLDLDQQMHHLDLKVNESKFSLEQLRKERETTSLTDQSQELIGRQEETKKIVGFLQRIPRFQITPNRHQKEESTAETDVGICVVAIVGMPGIGKTTLAQAVFNNSWVDETFKPMKVWVYVSDVFDIHSVTKTILNQLPSDSGRKSLGTSGNLDYLQRTLRQRVAGKRILIVLDDVWLEKSRDWNLLLCPLRSALRGSAIIATTRHHKVVDMMSPALPIHLGELFFEDRLRLLEKLTEREFNSFSESRMEAIGRLIADKCGGLPLALSMLGSLLRSAPDEDEWENILRQMWDLPDSQHDIHQALLLSYYHLPSDLKRCFAYCSIFPKNYRFEGEKLVLLWMAEGLLPEGRNSESMQEIGVGYFCELVSRSFLLPAHPHGSFFTMHNCIRDLACHVFQEIGVCKENQQSISRRARHFSYMQGEYDHFETFAELRGIDHLRTFLPFRSPSSNQSSYLNKQVPEILFSTESRLRVLSFSHYKINNLPDSLGNLNHLRYLDVSYTQILKLPDSVCNLCNLQSLLLSNCTYLLRLPAETWKLISLSHLDISGCPDLREMPRGIGSLSGLQTLTAFVVGSRSGASIRELRELQHIHGRLHISHLNRDVSPFDALEANLVGKPGLSELVLEWSDSREDAKDVLHSLMPHKNLRRLSIKNYRARKFPDWLGNGAFQVLTILHLSNCPNCLHLPPLGQLLSHQHLSISHFDKVETIGPEFYAQGSQPFKSLITLRIEEMSKWREWKDPEFRGTFASLEELYLVRCPQLIGDLPRGAFMLKRLEIDDCPKLDLASLVNFSGLLSLKLARVNIEPLDLVPLQELEELDVLHPTAGLLPLCLQLDVPITSLKTACFSSPPETEDRNEDNRWSLHYLHIKGEVDSLHFPITSFPQLNYLDFRSGLVDWHGGYGSWLERLYDLTIYGTLHFPEEGLCAHNLTTLVICGSHSLEALPKRMRSTLTSLRLLSVDECNELVSFPEDGLPTNLTTLKIRNCWNLKLLPERMHSSLESLQSLSIKGYNKLESFPDGGLPTSLRTLCIHGCEGLSMNLNNWPLRSLVSLEHLEIRGGSNVHLFPERDLLPTTLTHLCIEMFHNLKTLDGSELQRSCSQLEELKISNCKEAKFEAEEHKREIPRSLCSLEMYGCPLLEEWIRRELQRNPSKISHLCRINIGGREF
ncbi:hypothetical protein Ancab_029097 [Ancistrocladus abbreviatus]